MAQCIKCLLNNHRDLIRKSQGWQGMPATSTLGDKARWWVLGNHWSPGLAEMVIYI